MMILHYAQVSQAAQCTTKLMHIEIYAKKNKQQNHYCTFWAGMQQKKIDDDFIFFARLTTVSCSLVCTGGCTLQSIAILQLN